MFSKVLLVLSVTSVAFATVFVTAPVAATVYSGGKPATVTWQESGSAPTLKDFGLAKISIYTGNAQQQTSLQLLNPSVDVSTVSSINFTPDSTIGPNSNHYFIRFESLSLKDAAQTPALAFSAQFTLDSMTGTFPPAVLSQIAGQSTAPLAGQTSSTAGPTSTLPITTTTASKTATGTSSTTPSATKASSGMSIKAGWAGVAFGALLGVMMF
ncbi:hypothetical protein BYT27DRAFT_7236036 [Phlegmacium glaucopus]|nr:hypothetical protein BYT27DRAFT_7236036 [Phlegmacium glaucopus]